MAANSSLNLASLDFDTLKQNFKTFLASQSVFKDYNFEGSNINVLLDVMAYNSYLNSFYLNMVASEMFLDSAQKYDSMVSHAKELNYIPSSNKSSAADISFSLETIGMSGSLTIPKETKFVGTNSNGSFTFTTDQTTSWSSSNSTYAIANLQIYEGIYFQDTYLIDYNQEAQKFIISNPDIDTSSLTVTVVEDNGQTNTNFTQKTTLFGLKSDSEIFFLQAAQNNKYEIVFGDNVFGKHPIYPNIVKVDYMVTNGEPANGCKSFKLNAYSGSERYRFSTSTLTASRDGSERETISSIKYRAPRHYQTQYRAVTAEDYKTLIQANFNDIQAVNVYGGETLDEPQYGRVYVSASTTTGGILSEFTKSEIIQYLKTRTPLSIDVFYIDPTYLYLIVDSAVSYKLSLTTKSPNEIETEIVNAITNFNTTYLNDFDKDFHYSKFVAAIDKANPSILSNQTNVIMAKDYIPLIGQNLIFSIDFKNPFAKDDILLSRPLTNQFVVYSSNFSYNGVTAAFGEDGNGNIFIYEYTNSGRKILKANCGTVNYDIGKININSVIIDGYENDAIRFYAIPRNKDISVKQDTIINIDATSLSIVVTPE